MKHDVVFRPSGRGKAQCPPDPNYPNGIELDCSTPPAGATCLVGLPYPAPECGLWMVHCNQCAITIAVTTAGRPDDPISVRMDCGMSSIVQ